MEHLKQVYFDEKINILVYNSFMNELIKQLIQEGKTDSEIIELVRHQFLSNIDFIQAIIDNTRKRLMH